ncbi:hypothetical protein [Kluyvera ascorbata]|uniref:hypothetical protein n=1 Tax=Kluyvera ascorbata TaxID=51288 RepID=UPI0034D43823
MLENYLRLLAVGDGLKKWRRQETLPRPGVERVAMTLMSSVIFAFFGYASATKEEGTFFYVIASLHLLYPVYWMCRPKSGWDVECARRLENYKPLDLPAWVGLKRAVLEHDTLRLEDAECWFAREMLASQGIADVAESNAAEKYRFLSEEPVVGRKEGHGE